jgi:hypothetical protein
LKSQDQLSAATPSGRVALAVKVTTWPVAGEDGVQLKSATMSFTGAVRAAGAQSSASAQIATQAAAVVARERQRAGSLFRRS